MPSVHLKMFTKRHLQGKLCRFKETNTSWSLKITSTSFWNISIGFLAFRTFARTPSWPFNKGSRSQSHDAGVWRLRFSGAYRFGLTISTGTLWAKDTTSWEVQTKSLNDFAGSVWTSRPRRPRRDTEWPSRCPEAMAWNPRNPPKLPFSQWSLWHFSYESLESWTSISRSLMWKVKTSGDVDGATLAFDAPALSANLQDANFSIQNNAWRVRWWRLE